VKLGGGLVAANGAMDLESVTIAHNSAGGGGGILRSAGTNVTLENALLDENTGGNCQGDPTSLGHNLDSDGTCHYAGSGDLTGISAMLDILADNGGPTETHALLPGSPAIGAADDAACPAADQRGVSRPQGTHCDIGAFESELAEPEAEPVPTDTPASEPEEITFDPVEVSVDQIYQGGQTCTQRSVTIRVKVNGAMDLKSVGLFFLLEEQNGPGVTSWSSGFAMDPLGGDWYQRTLNAENLPSIASWQNDAWLALQFVANGPGDEKLATSGIFEYVTVTRCAQ
jgi:hypothetical protein